MGKTKNCKLPRAQVAHLRSGPGAVLVGLLRPLIRVRIGPAEVVAATIAGGIVLLTGLMLAGFGAANREGLAERYTAAARLDQRQAAASPGSQCHSVSVHDESCEDIWERTMAGGGDEVWNGNDDWIESQCKQALVCFETPGPNAKNRVLEILFENRNHSNQQIPTTSTLPDFTPPADQR